MSQDDRTAQEHLSPDERRTLLRAFADRMLLKVSAMDDPEDLPSVEKAMRVAAVIERIYSRCDRSERHAPDPRKLEAERADNEREAIKARVNLADTLEWGEQRRQKLGKWWDAAENATKPATPAPVKIPSPQTPLQASPAVQKATAAARAAPQVEYIDCTDRIEQARADLASQKLFEPYTPQPPSPSLRGPP